MAYYSTYSKDKLPENVRSLVKYDGLMFKFLPSSDILLRSRKKTRGKVTVYDISNRGEQKEIRAFDHSFSSEGEVTAKFDEWSKDESELVRFLSG